ncbi:hypothetical protein HRV97_16990 [Sphingomonas sp. HHU CXW]|uniref:Antitoxin-like ribbon-helix-helix domain-containing protein n=1 Tax=Sphingomonas hominis TaxID=2741495 RepID=A0ABX2JSP7_9SPHN|nr:ribbon-helix-helix domain-containing protein [Sphingomonas hominis]NTS66838.1 hypothetical protein [Sphingomonas hominis]
MSGKFSGLKAVGATAQPTSQIIAEPAKPSGARPSRQGKRVISGHFSPELSRGLNMLAVEQDKTVQALLGEAIDLLMRQYDRHPFGER